MAREKTAEVMFEHMQFNALYFAFQGATQQDLTRRTEQQKRPESAIPATLFARHIAPSSLGMANDVCALALAFVFCDSCALVGPITAMQKWECPKCC
eukprot:159880-Amphidinium_carterae.1